MFILKSLNELEGLGRRTGMNNKTLKNISILITVTIVSILTACGQVTSLPTQPRDDLSPLSGEVTPTGVHSEMLSALNTVRTQGTTCNGKFHDSVDSVSWNEKLAGAAKTQVKDILNRANSGEINLAMQAPPHVDSAGNRVDNRASAQGYSFKKVGEILASVSTGTAYINGVIQGWQGSTSHCEAIMTGQFEEVGIYFENGVWAAVFGNPR